MAALSESTYSYAAIVQPYMPVFYVAFLVTITLTPIMRKLAHRHGVVDDPDNKRKVHSQPIAYLGGVSIFLGWIAGVTVAVLLRPHNDLAGSGSTVQIPPGILLGAIAVVLFGLMDDVYSLNPKMKLLGQFVAAMLMILPGMLTIPGLNGTDFLIGKENGSAWMIVSALKSYGILPDPVPPYVHVIAPIFSAAVVVAVIISTCNATNLLDGLDGLCSGVTGVMSAGYLILSIYLAHRAMASAAMVDPVRICLSLALLGAVLGFLPFNFNPASIFMGDTGSMFLGYMCGTMILLFGQSGSVKWFLSGIIMFGLPMMDTLLAIVRRKLNGKPIFSPDSNHFHHFLIRSGLTVRRAVLLSYGVAAVFVSFGLVIVVIPSLIAFGVYLVLFGWIIVAAFKMGMIFQNTPKVTANTTLNLSVITPIVTPGMAPGNTPKGSGERTLEHEAVKQELGG
jgi:UDP-GlcNAc:undecaprenyl-phosphate GlcNAc-1-phosphate transferase